MHSSETIDGQKRLRTIALAAATDFEVRQIKRALGSCLNSASFTVIPVGVSCREMSVDWPDKSYSAIVSIGFAGALDPSLQPGTCLVPKSIVTSDQTSYEVDTDMHRMIATQALHDVHDAPLFHTARLLSSIIDKQRAYEHSNCGSCDMESGILAELARRLAIPFACVRIVLDPATAPLPHSIAGFANPGWTTTDFLLANLRRPRELPATAAILKHTAIASRALRQITKLLAERALTTRPVS